MFIEWTGPVGLTHLKFCAAVPSKYPERSICSADPEVSSAALDEIDTLSNELLVARYNGFVFPPHPLGDCCNVRRIIRGVGLTEVSVKACGAVQGDDINWPPSNDSFEDKAYLPDLPRFTDGTDCPYLDDSRYGEWDIADREAMCTQVGVNNLAAQLRHAAKNGACCHTQ